MPRSKNDVPLKLRTFCSLGFDYHEERVVGNEAYGECLFCGARNKLYINFNTTTVAMWECKVCFKKGNTYTFINEWYQEKIRTRGLQAEAMKKLADNRGMNVKLLRKEGIVHDGWRYILPVRNTAGALINLLTYHLNDQVKGLPSISVSLFGLETLSDNDSDTVYLCEGRWDEICLRDFLTRETETGIVLGVPGAGTWQDAWTEYLAGKKVVLCYDNDSPGTKGKARVYEKIKDRAAQVLHLVWPATTQDGYDIREYITKEKPDFKEFSSLIARYSSDQEKAQAKQEQIKNNPIKSGNRPSFKTVLSVYRKFLKMTPDLEDALRVIYAVVLSTNIPDDPLWVHIVAPPGAAKTALLTSISACLTCHFMSTMTPHALVSGFVQGGGHDPSILPTLDGKTLVLKDFTEILSMPRISKEEIYGTLRGAYDGEVEKPFGNGITRRYRAHFNVVTGVTPAIYAERNSVVGERFLMMHVIKGCNLDHSDPIRAAIKSVGKGAVIRQELIDIARSFLDVNVNFEEDVPEISDSDIDRISALAQIVAKLRATVERDFKGERKLLYRPQEEVGTRVAKELTKLLMGLSLINSPPSIGLTEYRILSRVAIDTCVGFNLEAIASLMESPGQTLQELSDDCSLAKSTLRDQLEDLQELGVIFIRKFENPAGRGAPIMKYYPSSDISKLWATSGLRRINGMVKVQFRDRQKKIRIVKKIAPPTIGERVVNAENEPDRSVKGVPLYYPEERKLLPRKKLSRLQVKTTEGVV